MFRPSRIFHRFNSGTGFLEWFFHAREGAFGPYPTKQQAYLSLQDYVRAKIYAEDDGGRSRETIKESWVFADTDY